MNFFLKIIYLTIMSKKVETDDDNKLIEVTTDMISQVNFSDKKELNIKRNKDGHAILSWFSKKLKINYDVIIDDDDYHKILLVGHVYFTEGYVRIVLKNGNSRGISLSRYLLDGVSSKLFVDHKNYNTLDNRKENLHICTKAEFFTNKKFQASAPSKYVGVSSTTSGKYIATISINGKSKHLGTFETAEEANEVRKTAAAHYKECVILI
jgi:hypothetical protein